MNHTIVILDSSLNGLGEVSVRDGEFLSVSLNRAGEEALGTAFEEWQTQGLPAVRSHIAQINGKLSFESGVERVQLRSPQFENVFAAWLAANGFYSLDLPEAALAGWNALCQLPLDPRERLMMALAFRDLQPEHLPAWISATEKLVKENMK